jgi:hypothetical protein
MILARTLTTLGVVAALGLSALPAHADQGRGRGGAQRADGGGASADRSDRRGPPQESPRVAIPRNEAPRGAQPSAVPARPRGSAGPIVTLPGATAQHRGGPYYPGPGYRGSYPTPRYYDPNPRYYGRAPRYYGPPPGYYRPRVVFPRPYYSFRPRLSIGFGVQVGFPVPFPAWAYGSPYPYPAPYAYPYPGGYPTGYPYPVPYPVPDPSPYPVPYGSTPGYPAQAPPGTVAVTPGAAAYGGVSLDISPADAEVYVDGGYAGRAGDFGPQAQPLTLTVGVHRIEVRAPGHRPLSFDVTITSGHVVPYQGVLQPGP